MLLSQRSSLLPFQTEEFWLPKDYCIVLRYAAMLKIIVLYLCGNALQYKTLIIESIKITLTLERMVFGDVSRSEPCKEQPLLIIGQYVFIIAITDTISFKKQ